MGFHHVAFATKDPAATHRFYTEVMGFELVKVVASATPTGTGFSKHFFYDTGSEGMIAFWDLHDDAIGDGYSTDLNTSIGLPVWVNHMAFDAPTMADLERHRDRWRSHGITVAQVDHDFCVSIYATDPNGIMVEFCHTTRPFTADEIAAAQRLVTDPAPPLDASPEVQVFHPISEGASA